jgi:hypothetical protein
MLRNLGAVFGARVWRIVARSKSGLLWLTAVGIIVRGRFCRGWLWEPVSWKGKRVRCDIVRGDIVGPSCIGVQPVQSML